MILRNLGLRPGRQALAAAGTAAAAATTPSPCLRTLSTSAARLKPPRKNKATESHGNGRPKQTPAQYAERWRQRQLALPVGSEVKKRYHPDALLIDPPHDVTLEMLMAAQTHMGHHTSQWNPANQRYIAGERDGIHIIGLETTAAYLRRAARVVEEVAYAGGLILFVGTRPTHMAVVERASDLAGGFHLFTNWTPGAITNRDVILANSTLAIVDGNDQPLDGFTDHLRDRRPVVPDLVVCLNPMDNSTMLAECAHETIPTIGIIDTNADPSSVTYQIPANDDSIRSVTVIAGVLGRAGERGQRRRKEAAQRGDITWQTPMDIRRFMEGQARTRFAAMGEDERMAIARGTASEKPLQREDLMTDEELMREITDGPIVTKVG